MSGQAHTQWRLACPPAQNLHEVRGVGEPGASTDLRHRQAVEERGLQHAHGELHAASISIDPKVSPDAASARCRVRVDMLSELATSAARSNGSAQRCVM